MYYLHNAQNIRPMLDKYVEQIVRIYNQIDTLIITDDKGIIVYYITYRPDVNTNDPQTVIGKHVLEAWSRDLSEDSSTILKVLATGEPVLNEYQEFHYGDVLMPSVNTTMPIRENGKLVGTATMVRYLWEPFARNEIVLDIPQRKVFTTSYSIDDIQGCSASISNLKEKIRMIAGTDSSVMIYGETGVGKELVAQSLHGLSNRSSKRFVSQNCAAIPENLLESILFGTVKGSYTGAENRPGLFETARGGTLFLDEVNSMSLGMQAKILKAIEAREVTRIGGTEPIPTDVRIISATNEPPMDCIDRGKLRRDLFYRLSVVEINLEPLRRRPEDIDFMTNYYINQFNIKMNRAITGVDDQVYALFHSYDWPGNVRELKNVLEGAFNIAKSRIIKMDYLPTYLIQSGLGENAPIRADRDMPRPEFGEAFNLDDAVSSYERMLITEALAASRNPADAAKKLGISRQRLDYKLNRSGLK